MALGTITNYDCQLDSEDHCLILLQPLLFSGGVYLLLYFLILFMGEFFGGFVSFFNSKFGITIL